MKATRFSSSSVLNPRLPIRPVALPVGFTSVAGEGFSGSGQSGLPFKSA
jgi:hypothetical protein